MFGKCLASLLTLLSDTKHIRDPIIILPRPKKKKNKKPILLVITLLNIKYDSVKGSLIVLLGREAAGCALPRVQSLTWQHRLALKAGMFGGSCTPGVLGGLSHLTLLCAGGQEAALSSRAEEPIRSRAGPT